MEAWPEISSSVANFGGLGAALLFAGRHLAQSFLADRRSAKRAAEADRQTAVAMFEVAQFAEHMHRIHDYGVAAHRQHPDLPDPPEFPPVPESLAILAAQARGFREKEKAGPPR